MIKKFLPIAYCILASLLFLSMSEAYAGVTNRTIYNYTDEDINIQWKQDHDYDQGCAFTSAPGVTTCRSHQDANFFIPKTLTPPADGVLGTPTTYAITYVDEGVRKNVLDDVTWGIYGHILLVNQDGSTNGFGVSSGSHGAYLRGTPTWIDKKINGKDVRIVANAFDQGGNVIICIIGKLPCTNYAERTVYNNTDFPVQIQWTPDSRQGNNGFIGFRTKNFGDFSNAASATINPHEKWTVVYQAGATGALDGWVQFPQTGSGTNFQGWGVGLFGDNNPQLKGSTFCSRVGNVNLRFGNAYQDPDSKDGANGGIEIINC